MEIRITKVKEPSMMSDVETEQVVSFLHQHLNQFGDPIEQITECIRYVQDPKKGGLIYKALYMDELVGVVVINKTGMRGYIPENQLVYIAVDGNYRGRGIGRNLLEAMVGDVPGDIALHVEPDNPAIKLYEKIGFTNKYLEMRIKNGNTKAL